MNSTSYWLKQVWVFARALLLAVRTCLWYTLGEMAAGNAKGPKSIQQRLQAAFEEVAKGYAIEAQ